MSKFNWFCAVSIAVLFFLTGIFSWMQYKQPSQKQVYVITAELFEGYEATKAKKKTLDILEKKQRAVLDSVKLQIELLNAGKKEKELVERKHLFNRLSDEFTKAYENEAAAGTEEIWTQLNTYTADYGSEKDYDFIFGTDGQGTLLYARKENNITEDLIQYCNDRYNGRPKKD